MHFRYLLTFEKLVVHTSTCLNVSIRCDMHKHRRDVNIRVIQACSFIAAKWKARVS